MIVDNLRPELGRIVLDRTGLTGTYDFDLQWTSDNSANFGASGQGAPLLNMPSPSTNGLSIFTAIQEQLGLKLEPQKGPVEVLVIDHLEKPSEN